MNTQPDPDLQTIKSQWDKISEKSKQEIVEIITRNDFGWTPPDEAGVDLTPVWDGLPEKSKHEIMEIITRND